jgi:ribosome-binding protein aMBF1 (putative translation factor)
MKLNALSVISVMKALREDLAPVIVLDEEDDGKKIGKEKTKKVKEDPAIARAYDQSGMTQQEIAKKAKVAASTVSRWKSEDPDVQRKPSFDNLKDLVQTLGQQPFRELKP